MVGRAERAVGHAAADANELDVGVAVGSVHLDLLEGAPGQEGRRATDEGDAAAVGEAGADGHEVLLGDAHVEDTVGEGLGAAAGLPVAIEDAQVEVGGGVEQQVQVAAALAELGLAVGAGEADHVVARTAAGVVQRSVYDGIDTVDQRGRVTRPAKLPLRPRQALARVEEAALVAAGAKPAPA